MKPTRRGRFLFCRSVRGNDSAGEEFRNMLEGKCHKCRCHFIGWALANPRHQICPNCGVGLDITEDGRRVLKGYSPFTAETYLINLPRNLSALRDETRNLSDG